MKTINAIYCADHEQTEMLMNGWHICHASNMTAQELFNRLSESKMYSEIKVCYDGIKIFAMVKF